MIKQFGFNILNMFKKLRNTGKIFHLFIYIFQISDYTHGFKFGGVLLAKLPGDWKKIYLTYYLKI